MRLPLRDAEVGRVTLCVSSSVVSTLGYRKFYCVLSGSHRFCAEISEVMLLVAGVDVLPLAAYRLCRRLRHQCWHFVRVGTVKFHVRNCPLSCMVDAREHIASQFSFICTRYGFFEFAFRRRCCCKSWPNDGPFIFIPHTFTRPVVAYRMLRWPSSIGQSLNF